MPTRHLKAKSRQSSSPVVPASFMSRQVSPHARTLAREALGSLKGGGMSLPPLDADAFGNTGGEGFVIVAVMSGAVRAG